MTEPFVEIEKRPQGGWRADLSVNGVWQSSAKTQHAATHWGIRRKGKRMLRTHLATLSPERERIMEDDL